MENVIIRHDIVGQYCKGRIVTAATFGTDLQRLLKVGAVEHTAEPVGPPKGEDLKRIASIGCLEMAGLTDEQLQAFHDGTLV